MKIITVSKQVIDVFVGNGWKNWSRFKIIKIPNNKKALRLESGVRLPAKTMFNLNKRVN